MKKKFLRVTSFVLCLSICLGTSILASSNFPAENSETSSTMAAVSNFEEELRFAGRTIANEKGLFVDLETMREYNDIAMSADSTSEELIALHRSITANSVSLDDIYTERPDLAIEAVELDLGLDYV